MNRVTGIDGGNLRPRPGAGERAVVFLFSTLLHIAAVVALSVAYSGTGAGGSHATTATEPLTVELLSPDLAADAARAGGGVPDVRELPLTQKHADVAIRTKGAGEASYAGDTKFNAELASLLAEDPFAGAGKSAYGAVLRKHIAAHSRHRGDRIGRSDAGLVVLRFRVARDGRVVDARVLRSPNSLIGEKALAALWRSEPLPGVPGELVAPLEVDVPIDFQVEG